MMLIGIGLGLSVLGVLSALSGPRAGTTLAVLPVVVWIGFGIAAQADGNIGSRESADLGAAFLTGILSFTLGSGIVRVIAAWRSSRAPASGND